MDQGIMYTYGALPEYDSIRLIDLHATADFEAEIQCSVIPTTFSEQSVETVNGYSALSYVWGEQINLVPIKLDGYGFLITRNLDSALRHLRDQTRARRMWIDAICINQRDDEEKSIQMQQMWKVYNTAQRTLIYLGNATLNSEDLIKTARSLQSPEDMVRFKVSLEQLLAREWFTRVWILQELAFSVDPWVFCGRTCIRWALFIDFLKITRAARNDSALHNTLSAIFEMDRVRCEVLQNDSGDTETNSVRKLKKILELRRGLGATDPKDMIYAHLSITRSQEQRNENPLKTSIDILPDYRKTTGQVYEEFAASYLEKNGLLDLLPFAESTIPFEDRAEGLPSWAPNWTEKESKDRRMLAMLDSKLGISRGPGAPRMETKIKTVKSTIYGIGTPIGRLKSVSQILVNIDYNLHLSSARRRHELGEGQSTIDNKRFGDGRLPVPIITTTSLPAAIEFMYELWNRDSQLFQIPKNELKKALGSLQGNNIAHEDDWMDTHILVHAGKALLWPSRRLNSNICSGRRLSLLENGTLALVPAISQAGDVLWLVDGMLVVFRDATSQTAIDQQDVDEDVRREYSSRMKKNVKEVRHFRFVGEAFIYPHPSYALYRRGTTRRDELREQNYRGHIFALH